MIVGAGAKLLSGPQTRKSFRGEDLNQVGPLAPLRHDVPSRTHMCLSGRALGTSSGRNSRGICQWRLPRISARGCIRTAVECAGIEPLLANPAVDLIFDGWCSIARRFVLSAGT